MYKRKTDFLWKHKTGRLKGKLTAKAKQHLSKKLTLYYIIQREYREEVQVELLIPTNTEFIYHAKLIYDSDRDVHHNFMTELKVTIIADEEMPKDKLIDFILDNLPEDYLKTIPFSNVQVGLTSKEKTTASEGSHIEVTKYSHNL